MISYDKSFVDVLKNLAKINNTIYFQKGNVIKSISPSFNIFAKAEIPFEIPLDFGIYDVSKLCSLLEVDVTRSLNFNEKYLEIVGKYTAVKYYYTEKEIINKLVGEVTNFNAKLPSCDVTFKLDYEILSEIMKQCSLINKTLISISFMEGKGIVIKSMDQFKADAANEFILYIDDCVTNVKDFTLILKLINLPLMRDNYVVNISKTKFVEFVGSKIQYLLASEIESKF